MSFAHYLLQVNLYLIVFYGFYKLLLDKETYFTLNRIYLVGAGALSVSIPFIRLEWLTEQRAAQQVYTSVNWDAVLQQATIVTETNNGFNWANAFVYIYCAGILFFLCRLVINLMAVKNLIANAKAGSAFSFLSNKIVDKNLPQMDVIDIHEDAHIKQWHTLDVLFFEILGVITWLNPIIYFYKKSIKNIHEFLADEQAAEFQGDKAEYALLILSKSFGISPNTLTNGFFDKSLIKKRIFMLQKERSKRIAIVKYGISIPLFAILIVFSSATVRKNENLISISEQIPLEKPIEMVHEMVTETPKEEVLKLSVSIDGKAETKWKAFYQFVSQHIKYPELAYSKEIQGNSQIKFTLRNSRVTDVISNVSLGAGCDEEVMKAVLSYRNFKSITDGKYAFTVSFKMPESSVRFKNKVLPKSTGYVNLNNVTIISYMAKSETNTQGSLKIDDGDKAVYDFVSIEKQPDFPGGIRKFYEYISRNIKYPEMAQENNVQGKVFLSFIVEKDGSLSDVQITRGLSSGTDEEAVRVLKESPPWNPGISNGNAVRVKYNINVNFTLNNDPPATEKKSGIIYKQQNPQHITYSTTKTATVFKGGKFEGLVVLNGKESGNGFDFTKINNNDIQSISVLKDVSATSLYGDKGKNGVLIITTKNNLFRKVEDTDLKIDKSLPNIQLRQKF